MVVELSLDANATTVWFSSGLGQLVTRSWTSRPARSSLTISRATLSWWAGVTQKVTRQLLQWTSVHKREPSPSFADRKSTRLNSSHVSISYAVFCLKKKKDHVF